MLLDLGLVSCLEFRGFDFYIQLTDLLNAFNPIFSTGTVKRMNSHSVDHVF